MLHCNNLSDRTGVQTLPIEAQAGMKWFRSNVRLGSRLALVALAIQFLLSFGHFHGSAQPASASTDAGRSAFHDSIGFAVTHFHASNGVSLAYASGPVRLKTSGDVPAGQPAEDCAICAVMALANALVDAAPPCLPSLQAVAFRYLAADTAFVDPNLARGAFQPRAPPIS
jgi:hypothetical protein